MGSSIGPALGITAEISEGSITISGVSVEKDLVLAVLGGRIERAKDNRLSFLLDTRSSDAQIQRLNERIGMAHLHLQSGTDTLSTDPRAPTLFFSKVVVKLSGGEKIFNPLTGQDESVPRGLNLSVETSVKGVLADHTFRGEFHARSHYLGLVELLTAKGTFEIRLV